MLMHGCNSISLIVNITFMLVKQITLRLYILFMQNKRSYSIWYSLAFVLSLLMANTANSQREIYRSYHDDLKYYFGLTLGYNSCYLSPTKHQKFLQDDSILVAEPGATGGIALGLQATLKLNRRFQFRFNPQLVIGGARYFNYMIKYPGLNETKWQTKNMPTTLWHFPFQFKFNSDRIGNFRTYLLLGGKYDISVISNNSNQDVNTTDWVVKLNSMDYGAEIGIGFNFFLEYFTLTPEIKISYGFANLLDRESSLKYSSVFDKLQSRMIMFTLLFED